jgi:transposase
MRRWQTGEIRAVIALHRRGLRQLDIARAVDRPPGSVGNLVARLARQGKLRFRQPAFGHSRASQDPAGRTLSPVRDDDP